MSKLVYFKKYTYKLYDENLNLEVNKYNNPKT